mgnify:FL=1
MDLECKKRQLPQRQLSLYFDSTLLASQRFVLAGVFVERHHRLFLFLAVEELQGLGDNLGEIFRLTVGVVFICLQASLKEDQATLFEVFLADLSEPAPCFNVDPLGGFLQLAAFVLPAVADSDAEMADFFAGGGELRFGVPAQVADQLNAV